MNHKSNAFTLIELLVVIAIIAILAAILFPVFAQAKLAAKKTTALSNAKNIGLSLQLYEADSDDYVVKAYFGAPAGCDWANIQPQNWYTWRVAIQPYMKNVDILADSTNVFSAHGSWQNQVAPFVNPNPAPQLMPTNFALNDAVAGVANGGCIGTHDSIVTTTTGLPAPSSTIYAVPSNGRTPTIQFWWGSNLSVETGNITDGSLWCTINPGTNALSGAVSSYSCPAYGVSPLHSVSRQIAFVYCDGHAKARNYAASLNPSGDTDDWDSADQIMQNGNHGTQADRQLVSQNLYPDLK